MMTVILLGIIIWILLRMSRLTKDIEELRRRMLAGEEKIRILIRERNAAAGRVN